jgi:hypothetical protein
LFPSISHKNPFVLIKFPNNSHQQPINIFLFSSSSQKVLIKFLLFPSTTHQSFCSHRVPKKFFVPMAMEDRQVSTGEHEGERWDSWETPAEC